jgi:hypothetical protein
MNSQAVFIHSLFRAGSTYLYSKFKESGAKCYQEPIHEIVISAQDDINYLKSDDTNSSQLRHNNLVSEYYSELYELGSEVISKLDEHDIYTNYFSDTVSDALDDYISSLLSGSEPIIAIQECRTSSRIESFKRKFGGQHIFLTRNPRDQWWSYRVDRYFDTTTQLIWGTFEQAPNVVRQLAQHIAIPRAIDAALLSQMDRYHCEPMSVATSYFSFYALWLLGYIEAIRHADVIIDMDRLSLDAAYRHETKTKLNEIIQLDFSDCRMPNNYLSQEENDFFASIEHDVENIISDDDEYKKYLDQVVELKKKSFAMINSLDHNHISVKAYEKMSADFRNALDNSAFYSSQRTKAYNALVDENAQLLEYKLFYDKVTNSKEWVVYQFIKKTKVMIKKIKLLITKPEHLIAFLKHRVTRYPIIVKIIKKIIKHLPWLSQYLSRKGLISLVYIDHDALNKALTPKQKKIYSEIMKRKQK